MGMVRLPKSGDDAEVTQTASNKVSTAAESGPEVITSALHSQKTIRADSTFQSIWKQSCQDVAYGDLLVKQLQVLYIHTRLLEEFLLPQALDNQTVRTL